MRSYLPWPCERGVPQLHCQCCRSRQTGPCTTASSHAIGHAICVAAGLLYTSLFMILQICKTHFELTLHANYLLSAVPQPMAALGTSTVPLDCLVTHQQSTFANFPACLAVNTTYESAMYVANWSFSLCCNELSIQHCNPPSKQKLQLDTTNTTACDTATHLANWKPEAFRSAACSAMTKSLFLSMSSRVL